MPGPEGIWVIIAIVVLFGASRLPAMGRNVGLGIKEFKKGVTEGSRGDEREDREKPASSDERERGTPPCRPHRPEPPLQLRRSRRPRANPAGEMSILEHIGELRNRLAKSWAALVITTLVAFAFLYEPVLDFVLRSYCQLPASVRIGTSAADSGWKPGAPN